MNTKRFIFAAAAAALFAGVCGTAQTLPTKYQIVLTGTAYTTNSAGQIVLNNINNRTLLKEVADADGTTDFSSWGLAYHFGGSDLGDTIEIIDRNTGATLRTLYGLYFGESFGRVAILSASGKQLKHLEYVYTEQNSHSLGSALLTDYFWFDNAGNTNAMTVVGQMQWVVAADGRHPKTELCTANFATVRPWKFTSSP